MAGLVQVDGFPRHLGKVPAVLRQILNRRQLSLLHAEAGKKRRPSREELPSEGFVFSLDGSEALGFELAEMME